MRKVAKDGVLGAMMSGGVARQPRVWNSAPPEGACRDEEASEVLNG